MKRQLVIFFMIAFALVLIPRVSTASSIPTADARPFCTQFLEQVAGFHMNESIVFNYTMGPVRMTNTQDTPHFRSDVSFNINNDHGCSNALFTFVDGSLWLYDLNSPDNLGTHESSLNESLSTLISALNRYQVLLNASYCEDFGRMVSTALETQELNVETSDSLLQIKQTGYNSSWLPTLYVSWFRKIDNQFVTPFRSIQVGMRNGLITRIFNTMDTYHVATTSIAVSYDQAINISRQYIEAFAQENQLNTVSISATLNYTIDGSAQRGDSFAIYPFWFVKGIYDKIAQGYNANSYSVIVWADDGSISGEGPDAGFGIGPSAAVNPLLFLVPAGFVIFVLGTGTYIRRKSKTRRARS
jgi:hypothetical protein